MILLLIAWNTLLEKIHSGSENKKPSNSVGSSNPGLEKDQVRGKKFNLVSRNWNLKEFCVINSLPERLLWNLMGIKNKISQTEKLIQIY